MDIIKNDSGSNFKTSRLSYIRIITGKLCGERNCVLPITAAEERSFEDALSHVVHLLPNKIRDREGDTIPPLPGTKLRNWLKAYCRKAKWCRKKCLKEILYALQFMQRERAYDPPADDEIQYYLLIKKYVRSMLTFFSARELLSDSHMYGKLYDCFCYSTTLHNVNELVEINRYLADFSAFVSEMDITNGSAIKPLMGIQENYEVAPIIHGSKERSSLFYWHKFKLAFFDLRSSEYSCFPPSPEEEQSYLRVLDHISSPFFSSRNNGEAVNIYSKELHFLFLDRIEREIKDLERHCIRTRLAILEKISIMEPWESLLESYENDPYISDVDNEEEELAEMSTRLAEKCKVSKEDLPDYIASVEKCRDIARSMYELISARSYGCYHLVQLCYPENLTKFGWDALHALTLFKPGSFSSGTSVFRENIILRNFKKKLLSAIEYDGSKTNKRKRVAEEEQNKNVKFVEGTQYEKAKVKKLKKCVPGEECYKENVKTLEGIVEDLRRIGGSDTQLDKEETILMYKIWLNVASSVHFFFCATAYEQQSHIICGGLSHVRQIGVKTRKLMMKNSTNAIKLSDPTKKAIEVRDMIDWLEHEMRILSEILYSYQQALLEKGGSKST